MKEIVCCIVLMLFWSHAFIIGWLWDEEQQKRSCASVQNEACKHCGIQRLFWRFVSGVLYTVNDFTRSEVVRKTHGLSLSLSLFSWWSSVHCDGVLQWWRSSSKDTAAKKCSVPWRRGMTTMMIVLFSD